MITNIDDVRARIMELESAAVFDRAAWVVVLMALGERPSAHADAMRRMETAKGWQQMPADDRMRTDARRVRVVRVKARRVVTAAINV